MGKFMASRMESKYTNDQMAVAMKLMMTTNKNQLVPGNLAGEASARQTIPII
jgi:hypothetical protein